MAIPGNYAGPTNAGITPVLEHQMQWHNKGNLNDPRSSYV